MRVSSTETQPSRQHVTRAPSPMIRQDVFIVMAGSIFYRPWTRKEHWLRMKAPMPLRRPNWSMTRFPFSWHSAAAGNRMCSLPKAINSKAVSPDSVLSGHRFVKGPVFLPEPVRPLKPSLRFQRHLFLPDCAGFVTLLHCDTFFAAHPS